MSDSPKRCSMKLEKGWTHIHKTKSKVMANSISYKWQQEFIFKLLTFNFIVLLFIELGYVPKPLMLLRELLEDLLRLTNTPIV